MRRILKLNLDTLVSHQRFPSLFVDLGACTHHIGLIVLDLEAGAPPHFHIVDGQIARVLNDLLSDVHHLVGSPDELFLLSGDAALAD